MKEDYNKNFWHKFYLVYLKIWRVLLSLVLIASAAGIYFFFFAGTETVKASWWNDSWLYRQAIPVTNNISTQTNVYISVTLDTYTASSSMQADCGDFRFTKEDGSLLSYYIVSGCRTATNVIHINFDSFPAGAQSIYFYYGNPSAENGFSASDFSVEASSYTIGAVQAVETGPGPVGYWSFDEGYGATATDASGQGNDGVIAGAVWKDGSECVSGKCLWFDGSSSYIRVATSSVLDLEGQATFSVWIKPVSFPDFATIVAREPGGNYGYQFEVFDQADDKEVLVLWDSSNVFSNYKVIKQSEWQHVVVVIDPIDVTFYVNGVESGSENWVFSLDKSGDHNLFIGSLDGASEFFHGFIDEVKIYPYARSADQVKQDYNAGLAGVKSSTGVAAAFGGVSDKWLTDGLVGYWKFDESATTSGAIDSSGNGNTGTFYGHASTTAGKFGNSFIGNGISSSSVYTATSDSLNSIDYGFSVAGWFKTSDINAAIITSYQDFGTGYFDVMIDGSGNITYTLADLDQSTYQTTLTGNDNNWHHFVLVRDTANKLRNLYVDGGLAKSVVGGNGEFITYQTVRMSIGADYYSNGNHLDGQIDEVRIYNRALSPDEVRRLYEWAPGPVAHWKFDELEGTTAFDSVASSSFGGGNDGSISGAAWTNGKYGSALNFEENNENINAGSKASIDDLGAMTISAWIYPRSISTSNFNIIVQKGATVAQGNFWFSIFAFNTLFFTKDFSSTDLAVYGPANFFELNKWNYVTLTWDGTNSVTGVKFYNFGIPASSYLSQTNGAGTEYSDSALDLFIASDDFPFDGIIDDVRIYNYARTQKQILEDMAGASAGASASQGAALKYPVLDLNFDEGRGAVAYDSSIHKNNGSLEPGTGGTNTASSSMWTKNGKVGGAMEFDGTDDTVRINSSGAIDDLEAFSMSAWIKPIGEGGESGAGRIFNKHAWGFIASDDSPADRDKALTFYKETSETELKVQAIDNSWTTGVWQNVILTWDGGKDASEDVKIYVNGKEVEYQLQQDATGDFSTDAGHFMYLGSQDGSGYYFDGSMDEVKIWNYALSEEEIKSVYNQNSSLVVNSQSRADNNGTTTTGAATEYCVPGDTALCDEPVLELKMDEMSGVTAYDTSGNGNNGVLTWMSTNTNGGWTRGKRGAGILLDGIDDVVTVSDPGAGSALDITSAITLEAWVRPDTLIRPGSGGYQDIITKCNEDNLSVNSYAFSLLGDEISFAFFNTGWWEYNTTNANLATGTLYHLAATYSYAGDFVKIYINGVIKLDTTLTQSYPLLANNESLDIGYGLGVGATAENFQGMIDEARVYNYARTPAQIAWDYNKGKPIAHWRFDECSGSTIHDESGNGNHGTLNLGTAGTTATGTCASSSDSFWYNGRSGKYNSSGSFDGGSDWVSTISDPGLPTVDYTYSVWTRLDSLSDEAIIESVNDSAGSEFRINILSEKVQIEVDTTTSVTSAVSLVVGEWYHLLTTRKDGTIKIYINGEQDPATGYDNDILNFTGCPLIIGADVDSGCSGSLGNYTDGQIDEVKIWNYALTAEQIKQEFNGGSIRFGE
ncbi:hypothetical protein A2303_00095 [Candidatus Falkowbacteria bacterium RIFOXYB2_FULL_47_14]|uniref:LamG-like jellyroll fold domain-containing protein n=1 Tax=Candidatus Falkowbacteria bacterium RIFOXYA2_FULL_47_19 TaxID=1797994 RepID=A0A1F5SF25_9BACT|nr:MAG: hypothetical protein A2227_05995 [Candidatus Falkowbacteria bacterium RIFOXYA2_FULL_47_19]OGF35094.1 MAG: hypothetical protein A2468_06565 [Candidatus Falkowbacteria bacterium RIFOXYC2_FULL_46_15]OGF42982.1 MAG: hypothetical protein A2303_00095 [Candidatus Falkowbacteria bacterium RIFOXYB2_FULL_47_14]